MFNYIYIAYRRLSKDKSNIAPTVVYIGSHSSNDDVTTSYFKFRALVKNNELFNPALKTKRKFWWRTDKTNALKSIRERVFLCANKVYEGEDMCFIISLNDVQRIIQDYI
jgi:hypothetical protein